MTRKAFLLQAVATLAFLTTSPLHAQFTPNPKPDDLTNVSRLKPPPGSKVALVVFEDLGCPACAHAHPIEIQAAAAAHVPILRFDFPIPSHVWTFQAAVDARFLQEKATPALADQYRSDVFAAQRIINSKEDLAKFTDTWFSQHGQKMPGTIDTDGKLSKQVQADFDFGRSLNVHFTPTVLIITATNHQTVCGTANGSSDPEDILPVLKAAQAAATSSHATHTSSH